MAIKTRPRSGGTVFCAALDNLNLVGSSAWILLGLTFIVIALVLPQVAKSRRLMGQARSEDRFSENMRVLDLEKTSNDRPAVQVSLYQKASSSGNSTTRPLRMAQLLRDYTEAKAQRSSAAASRQAAVQHRAILLGTLIFTMLVIVGLASARVAPWWGLSVPGTGVGLVLAWGAVAAKRGRSKDLKFLQEIRSLERELEKTSAGRAALHADKPRGRNHWAQVARESLRDNLGTEPNLTQTLNQLQATRAVERAALHAQNLAQEKLQTKATSTQNHDEGLVEETSRTQIVAGSDLAAGDVGRGEDRGAVRVSGLRWDPTPIPAPSYTLRAPDARREVVTAQVQEPASVAVPLRPQVAQYLPAGVALKSKDVVADPLDLESILERRRASGD